MGNKSFSVTKDNTAFVALSSSDFYGKASCSAFSVVFRTKKFNNGLVDWRAE